MDDRVEQIDLFSGVATSSDSNERVYQVLCNYCLVGALACMRTLRDAWYGRRVYDTQSTHAPLPIPLSSN